MPFAVGKQTVACLGHRGLVTDRSHRVLQRAARAHVHVHIAAGHQRQLQAFAERLQLAESGRIVGTTMQFDGEPAAVREARRDPCAVRVVACQVSFLARKPQRQQALGIRHVIAAQLIVSFRRAPTCEGEQLA